MPSRLAVTRGPPAAGTIGSTFDREQRALMWRRGRTALAVGVGICVLMNVLGRWVLYTPEPLDSPYAFLVPNVYLAYVVIFGVGLGLVWRDVWNARTVALIVLGTVVASGVLDAALTAVLYPTEDRFYGAALFLFLAAALMPWPLAYQAALGVVVVLVYPVAGALASAAVPEVAAFWDAQTESSIRQIAVDQTIMIAVLAAVSVYITRTLYTMRRELQVASRVGNYLIEAELGSGGMGKVYRAQHAMIQRPTAVKVMEAEAARSPESLARFEREVQLSATLTHPNTITVYDFGRTEDATFYYVMEYLDGLDLQRLVQRFGPVEPARAVHILRQVCGSLAEAHGRDIIHRDIKPSNIFLTQRGGLHDFVKVLDFGLAKQLAAPGSPELTQVGSIFGTPLFMAPEAAAEASVDHRADIYSVGCVAYWMLTGRPPFEGSSPFDVIAKHLRVSARPPSHVSELTIPQILDEIVLKCLEKKPGDRFETMTALLAAIDEVPLVDGWTEADARQWWELHRVDAPSAPDLARPEAAPA